MYIKRHIEKQIMNPAYQKGAVAVTGARQTGKSTMLEHLLKGVRHITLDDLRERELASISPDMFIKDIGVPVFIDEIQRSPEILSYIKLVVDTKKEDGLYYLSGSQKFNMMKDMSESLAGRVAIYELLGFSMRELKGDSFDLPFLPTAEYLKQRQPLDYDIWEYIHKGSMPELYAKNKAWDKFFSDYVATYLERDVSQLSEVGDTLKFYKFMQVLAARIGNLLNLSEVCNEVGNLSQPTAQRWLSILVKSNIVFLLPPFFNNAIKRSIKTPKLYFLDTGLAAHLSRWETPAVLKNGAMMGAYFENFVVLEILKSYYNTGIEPKNLYFYRDKDKREIDLIIVKNGKLHPIEIKHHSSATVDDAKAFKVLEKSASTPLGEGAIICTANRHITLAETIKAIPVWYI